MKPTTFLIAAALLAFSPLPSCAQVVLSEIMYHAPQSDNYEEFIELYNTSATAPVNLTDWLLGDQDGLDTLKDAGHGLILPPHAFALVLDPGYWGHSTAYDAIIPPDALILTISDNSFGSGGLRNDPPDTVILRHPSAATADSFCYPSGNAAGFSYEKIRLDGGDDPANWAVSLTYLGTPGSINSVQPPGLDLAVTTLYAAPSPLPFGSSLWLQTVLTNLGLESISGGQTVFGLSVPTASAPDTVLGSVDFGQILPADSATLELSVPAVPPGPHRVWAWHNLTDAHPENNVDSLLLPGGYSPATIIINEFMAHPTGQSGEWVELLNPGSSAVDIMGFSFSDADTSDPTVIVDSSVELSGGEYALFAQDSSIFTLTIAPGVPVFVLGSGWKALNDDGDAPHLFDAAGGVQDVVPYFGWDIPTGISLERIYTSHPSADPSNWRASSDPSGATPGRANSYIPPLVMPTQGGLSFTPDPFDPDRHGSLAITLDLPAGTASAAVIAYDLRGRRLKVIIDAAVLPGPLEVLWDGRDTSGRRLSPGLYLLFAEFRDAAGNRQCTVKKTLVVAGRL